MKNIPPWDSHIISHQHPAKTLGLCSPNKLGSARTIFCFFFFLPLCTASKLDCWLLLWLVWNTEWSALWFIPHTESCKTRQHNWGYMVDTGLAHSEEMVDLGLTLPRMSLKTESLPWILVITKLRTVHWGMLSLHLDSDIPLELCLHKARPGNSRCPHCCDSTAVKTSPDIHGLCIIH